MAPPRKFRAPRNCVACGVEFTPTTKNPAKVYCSVKCAAGAMGKANATGRREFFCKLCGKQHFPGNYGTLYCSPECAKAGRKAGPRPPTIPAEERFWAKVDKSGDCWVWTAGVTDKGYGVFHPTKQTLIIASRYSWELANGPIPVGLYVLHKCDRPSCVRPDHLFLGTKADNNRDMAEKGRANPGEQHYLAKLTWEAVAEIRARHAAGEGLTELGRQFGVSHSNIWAVVTGRSWKNSEVGQNGRAEST